MEYSEWCVTIKRHLLITNEDSVWCSENKHLVMVAIVEFMEAWPEFVYVSYHEVESYYADFTTIMCSFSIIDRDYQRLKLMDRLPPNSNPRNFIISDKVPYHHLEIYGKK